MATTLVSSPQKEPSEAKTAATSVAPAAGGRLVSLDIFRGATIAAMILVNNAGNWKAVYWPLEHAEWNGWTPTDLIFPFFLFIVGVSMVLSFEARRARGATRGELLRHVVQRSLIIYAIGFALSFYGRPHLETVRFYGVLQRIAAVYLVASVLTLYTGRRVRAAVSAVLLIGYWLLMTRTPVPGFGLNLTPDGNLAAYVDRKLLYEHLWVRHRYDPEGVLSTFPAIVTCLLGVFTGEWLRSRRTQKEILRGLVISGAAGLVLGSAWGMWFPINKNIWTSSYVLFTAGFALALLAACYWAVEIRGWRRWGAPFVWYGMNAITVYAASGLVAIYLIRHKVSEGVTIKEWVYQHWFAPLGNAYNASVLFASAYVLAFWVLAWVMYRKKIFLRI